MAPAPAPTPASAPAVEPLFAEDEEPSIWSDDQSCCGRTGTGVNQPNTSIFPLGIGVSVDVSLYQPHFIYSALPCWRASTALYCYQQRARSGN